MIQVSFLHHICLALSQSLSIHCVFTHYIRLLMPVPTLSHSWNPQWCSDWKTMPICLLPMMSWWYQPSLHSSFLWHVAILYFDQQLPDWTGDQCVLLQNCLPETHGELLVADLTSVITSSNGNIFRVTGPLCGQWRGALMFSLICTWMNGWVNNREAGDLRQHHAHYGITVMLCQVYSTPSGIIGMIISEPDDVIKWKLFSALLTIGAGNSPVTGEFPSQRPVARRFDFFICACINSWINNGEAGDLRRHSTHYDVTLIRRMAVSFSNAYTCRSHKPSRCALLKRSIMIIIFMKLHQNFAVRSSVAHFTNMV